MEPKQIVRPAADVPGEVDVPRHPRVSRSLRVMPPAGPSHE